MTAALILAALALLLWRGLPLVLGACGLHPAYQGPRHSLPGKRALLVTTSHNRLNRPRQAGGRPTGVFASEMTAPYYAFLDAGMQVDVASIAGGAVPVDPMSLLWCLACPADRRYRRDQQFLAKTANAAAVGDIDFTQYDIVFLAGGWGAAYDMVPSKALADGLSAAWAHGAVIGGVCHGPLGLVHARDIDGGPLLRGRRASAVTNRQIRQLGIGFTPEHPESALRAAGALYESRRARVDMFASHTVADGRLVTGQNQNDGESTAQQMLRAAGAVVADNPTSLEQAA